MTGENPGSNIQDKKKVSTSFFSLQIHIFYALLSGIMFSVGWLGGFFSLFLFLAFIPLLLIENDYYIRNNKKDNFQVFYFAFLAFSIRNIYALYGIGYTSITGAIIVIIYCTLIMSMTFWLIHIIRIALGRKSFFIVFLFIWVAFEYLTQEGEIDFPALNLGNGLADLVRFIQWYEYTGMYGGTIWILILNFVIYRIIISFQTRSGYAEKLFLFIGLVATVFIPPVFSDSLYNQQRKEGKKLNVAILQPNIDPFTEKFDGLSQQKQLDIVLEQIKLLKNIPDLIIAPETLITEEIDLSSPETDQYLQQVRKAVNLISDSTSTIIGANTIQQDDKDTLYFNSAVLMSGKKLFETYHKSKPVIGTEKMPFSEYFRFLDGLLLDLGGYVGTNSKDRERNLLTTDKDSIKLGAVICYESIFGEFTGQLVKDGAELIVVITNDGWWKRASVYLQHFRYSRLRAIETRRWIVRSANTGISAIIDPNGNIIQATQGWENAVIEGQVMTGNGLTFYVLNGDFLAKTALFFSVLILLSAIVKGIRERETNRS